MYNKHLENSQHSLPSFVEGQPFIFFENKVIETRFQPKIEEFDLIIGLSSRSAYLLAPAKLLHSYLKKTLEDDIMDPIVSCAQEALSNALLWNNLAIDKGDLNANRSNLNHIIERKLMLSQFADLPIVLTYKGYSAYCEVSIYSQPQIRLWNEIFSERPVSSHRGLAIINAYCDEIRTCDQEGRITMKFNFDHMYSKGIFSNA